MLFMKKYKEYLILIIFTMGTQAAVYFLIKNFIHDYHIINSFINFPLVKPFVYFYDIWYPFIILCAFIVFYFDKENYKKLIYTMVLATIMSEITFLVYPTMVIRPEISINSLTDFVLYITYKLDSPAVNCLPSVHCLYCFITSFYIITSKNLKTIYKVLICTFSLSIVLSTIFIHQHIIEDAFLSLAYTSLTIFLVYLFKDKIKKVLKFMF